MRFLIAMLFVAACAQGSPSENPISNDVIETPTPAPANGTASIIELFGATFCSPCKRAMPQVQEELDQLPKSKRGQIEFRLYVTDVKDQAGADNYRNQLKLDAKAFPDPGGKLLRARKLGSSIPAGIVLDGESKVLQKFEAGMFFIPKDIVAVAASKAK